MTPPAIERVGVVGAGTMGAGIAQVCAAAGLGVTLVDVGAAQLERGTAAIATSLARLEARGALTSPAAAILGRITAATGLDALAAVEVVIEAATEELPVKVELFRRLDAACAPGALLLSNTSSIAITRLGAATSRPAQVAGMHFMNPVPVMPLVEIVRGLRTSEPTITAVRALAAALGKTAVESRDVPGFIANRILMPMLNEAFFALAEGVGSAEDIDKVMRLGMNHPMGPLALADLIGLDVCLAILEVLHRDLGDPKYRPAPLLRQYVAAGWLGRKTGRGVHLYADGREAPSGSAGTKPIA